QRAHDRKTDPLETSAEPAAEPLPEPVPTAAPSPSPTAEPSPSAEPADGGQTEGDDSTPQPDPGPSLAPADPPGFVLGFDSSLPAEAACSCLAPTKVESESVGISDTGLNSFSQKVSGTAKASGSPAYGLTISQTGNSTNHQMDFGLRTDEGLYMYRATGYLVERGATEWGGWSYRYAGTYELASRSSSDEQMPASGSYTVDIFVSWRETRITYSNFALD
ncbi:MAG: hypothetical protein ACRD1T_15365, partial [Acidimicrobiia bacterium]